MKISGSNVVATADRQGLGRHPRPAHPGGHDPGLRAARGDRRPPLRHDRHRGRGRDQGHLQGSCALSDLKERESLVMKLQGAGAPGTVDATVDVAFADLGSEGTQISYEADAVVGGMVGGVGQRMLSSVSKRMAGEFFSNVGSAISAPAARPPGRWSPPARRPRMAGSTPPPPRPAASPRATTS